MASEDSVLQIVVRLKNEASTAIDELRKSIEKTKEAIKPAAEASTQFAIGVAAAATAVGTFGLSALKAAAGAEQTRVAFTTMLGSAQDAQRMYSDLVAFAAKTPFNLTGVEQAAKQLLAYGFEQEDIIPNLTNLGNIASGVGMDKLPNLILAFGQVKAATRLTGMELRQFTEAGVPLLDTLSQNLKKPVSEIQNMVSEGRIGFGEVEKALASLSGEGGRFNDLMEAQSRTLGGMWSNLQDSWEQFLRGEGAELLEWGKQFVGFLTDVVQNKLPPFMDAVKKVTTFLAENKFALLAIVGAIVGAFIPAAIAATIAFGAFMATLAPFMAFGVIMGAMVGFLADRFGGLGNAFIAVGKTFQIVGLGVYKIFQNIGNFIIDWVNGYIANVERLYNGLSSLFSKIGVDIGKADLQIDFQFDTGKTEATMAAIGAQIDQMAIDAKNAKIAAQSAADSRVAIEYETTQKITKIKKDASDTISSGSASDAKKAKKEIEDHAKAVEKLGEEYKDLSDKGKLSLQELGDEHKKKVDDINDNIAQVSANMAKLSADFNRTATEDANNLKDKIAKLNQSFSRTANSDVTDVASDVIKSEEKIAEIKAQIAKEGSAAKVLELQAQLDKEQKAYDAQAEFIKSIDGDVKEARRRANLTELERSVEDYKAKRAEEERQYSEQLQAYRQSYADKRAADLISYQEKRADYAKQWKEYQQQLKDEVLLYTEKTDSIKAIMLEADQTYKNIVEDQKNFTINAINEQIKAYQQLASAISKVNSANTAAQIKTVTTSVGVQARATGGPVSAGSTYLVGEDGPELFSPINSGTIIPNNQLRGGGVNITINNPQVRSDADIIQIRRVIDDYFRPIMINNKLTA